MNAQLIRDELLARSPLPPLFPETGRLWKLELKSDISALAVPPLVKAGLHCLNDDLESAHVIAQDHEGPDGNYWHAIIHRREQDFGNAKYWLSRVGRHPIWPAMRALFRKWEASAFVDLCEVVGDDDCLRTQSQEMNSLLEHVWSKKS